MLLIDTGTLLMPGRGWYSDDDSDSSDPSSPTSPKSPKLHIPKITRSTSESSIKSTDSPPPPYEHIPIPQISTKPTVFPPEFPPSISPNAAILWASTTSLCPPSKTKTLVTTALTEAVALTSFAVHQIQTLSTGIHSLLLRSGHLPGSTSWSLLARIALHLLKSNLSFHGLSMQRARIGSLLVAYGQPIPSGVEIQPVKIEVSREELIRFEREGERCRLRRRDTSLPKVQGEIGPDTYTLEAEFITPLPTEKKTRKRDYIFSFLPFQKTKPLAPPSAPHPPPPSKKIILYLHGGAYILGNTLIYRQITSRIARETGCRVFAVNYRLAPENAFPAAVHDAFAAFLWLIRPRDPAFLNGEGDEEWSGCEASDVVFMGDSAGAGLVMALNNYLNLYLRGSGRDLLVPLPGASILLSPWVDLTFRAESWYRNSHRDWLPRAARNIHEPIAPDLPHPVYMYLFGERAGRKAVELLPFLNGLQNDEPHHPSNSDVISESQQLITSEDPATNEDAETTARERIHSAIESFIRHPLVSPIFSPSFTSLPPLLIQSGACEVLADESLALAHKYDQDNVGRTDNTTSFVRHECYPDMGHVFQLVPWVPASRLAMRN
ncbi:hypothetical protein HK097_002005, partial [Rhizophlyctis rosea]